MIPKQIVVLCCAASLFAAFDFVTRVYSPVFEDERILDTSATVIQFYDKPDKNELMTLLTGLEPVSAPEDTTAVVDPYLQYDGKNFGDIQFTLIGIYGKSGKFVAVVAIRESPTDEYKITRLMEKSSVKDVFVEKITHNMLVVRFNDDITTLQLFKPVRDNT